MAEIKHFIVLMMENRSFDHMLGFLQSPAYPIDGLSGTESNDNAAGNAIVVNRRARYSGDLRRYPPMSIIDHRPPAPRDESRNQRPGPMGVVTPSGW